MSLRTQDLSLVQPGCAFINGAWIQSSSTASFQVFDPASWEPVAEVPDLGEAECAAAVVGATGAFAQLKALTGKQRGELLRNWFTLVKKSEEELAALITGENGKPLGEARGEVAYALSFIDWFAAEAPRVDGSVFQSSDRDNRIITMKQPVGVVGIVTPWNFPAAMITRKVAAALAAGCPCVVKPAPETPLTALALAYLAHAAGFPPGSLSIVTTQKNTVAVGKVLTEHPAVRKFSFTGSTAVGKLLAAQCTKTLKKMSLELGGNAPFIVFDDADLEKAADSILASKFRLSGQTCVCTNRLYLQSGIHDKLAAILVQRVRQFRLGPGRDPESTLGPLITEAAAKKVARHVQDAVSRGASVLIGGEPAKGLGKSFFPPTVIVNVHPDSLCANEETFGPLLPVFKFDTEEQVIHLANNTDVGLAGYFFTENVSCAWRIAEALETGMVGVNTGIISDVASPFGGIKESGQGREGSTLGIEEYLEVKSVTFRVSK
ncbi:aldehyde dehydrogenase [Thozetella sp. PMI_491]|nr:aldehyde dehydrogenase [Thozetella sp. PMI_491]